MMLRKGSKAPKISRDYNITARKPARRKTMLSAMKFEIILWGMAQLLSYAAWRYPAFAARLRRVSG